MRFTSFRPFAGITLNIVIIVLVTVGAGALAVAADLPAVTKAPPPDSGRLWVEFDYLAWTVKGDKLPPLVTTSPPGTPQVQAGVLGAPGASVLFGDSTVNDEWRSGLRARMGYWFDSRRRIGIEGSFFGLEQASTEFNAGSAGTPILARPFFDALANQQAAALSAFPGLVAGSVNINETSRFLGADALYRQQIGSWGSEHFSVLIGYRYLHSSDKLGSLRQQRSRSLVAGFQSGPPLASVTRSTRPAPFTASISV